MGVLVTFEGIEGCGKTTQMRMAADYLKERHVRFLATEEPGGTPLGRKIREILLNQSAFEIGSEAELLLFLAARAQHVKDVILPALRDGCWVLCDRFSDATIAYQGFGRGIAAEDVTARINCFHLTALKPDCTFLFDLPVEMGLGRAMKRIAGNRGLPAEDRFEHEAMDFHSRVREGYLTLARQEPDRFRVIDAACGIAEIQEQIRCHLSELYARHTQGRSL
jgi:dTMP kinase